MKDTFMTGNRRVPIPPRNNANKYNLYLAGILRVRSRMSAGIFHRIGALKGSSGKNAFSYVKHTPSIKVHAFLKIFFIGVHLSSEIVIQNL